MSSGSIIKQPDGSLGPGHAKYAVMPPIGSMPGVPVGLEYLDSVDILTIKQNYLMAEESVGLDCRNRYTILNNQEQQVYQALEEPETSLQQHICGKNRGFTIHIIDNNHEEILTLIRPFKCCVGCECCADGYCMYPMYVNDKMGHKLGMVRMMNYCCRALFGVFDHDERLLYQLRAPLVQCQCCCGCTGDRDFPVMSVADNTKVAKLSKIWTDAFRAMLTLADCYRLSFSTNLDTRHKALIFASTFLIDFTLTKQQRQHNTNR